MSVPNIEHDRVASLGQGGEPVSPATTVAVLDIGSLFSAVWRRRRSVIATALAMALLAALVALAIPPQYKATAKLLVDPAGLNVLRDDVTRGPGNADAALAEAESQIGVLRSSDIMLEVIGRTGEQNCTEKSPNSGLSFFRIRSVTSQRSRKPKSSIPEPITRRRVDRAPSQPTT